MFFSPIDVNCQMVLDFKLKFVLTGFEILFKVESLYLLLTYAVMMDALICFQLI